MIVTTDFNGETVLIDPLSIDLVQYQNTRNIQHIDGEANLPVKLVFVTVQGTTIALLPEIFEADLLPLLMEKAHGIHNAGNSSIQ